MNFLYYHGAAALLLMQLAADPQKLARELFPDREAMHTLRLDEIARHMNLRAGSGVADVGCGSGEVAMLLSRAVGPTGRVWAVDIDKKQVAAARRTMRRFGAKNVTVLHSAPADPRLPEGQFDAILLLDVYHEIDQIAPMLAGMRSALKPDGRLVIIDPLPRKTGTRPREVQMKNHVLQPALARKDVEANGFQIVHQDEAFLDWPDEEGVQWLLVARPNR